LKFKWDCMSFWVMEVESYFRRYIAMFIFLEHCRCTLYLISIYFWRSITLFFISDKRLYKVHPKVY